jgi:general secretion pathway protein J
MKHNDLHAPDRGLSLIELVVAMALFALVAIMGLQSLTGTMRVSERLTRIDTETAELGSALALLRNDLSAVFPMLFYPPQGAPRSAVELSQDGMKLGLSLAGQRAFSPAHTDRHRAEWTVDVARGTLSRRVWPTLIPARNVTASKDATVLTGVRGFTLRTFWQDVGWVTGATPPVGTQLVAAPVALDQDRPGAPPPVYFSAMPLAVELTIQTQKHGDLRLVQALQ